jgi:type II secretory pathway component GspD/PulD (secretin)
MKTPNLFVLAATAALTLGHAAMCAQTQPTAKTAPEATAAKAAAEAAPRRISLCELPGSCSVKVFYLRNASQASDANEIQVAIRNLVDPQVKIYLVPSQNALVVQATPEILQLTQSLIDQLDLSKKIYRLTYTITETEAGKGARPQHFVLIAVEGQRAVLKQGSKVPVATGSFSASSTASAGAAQTQFTYLDVGMNFDATLSSVANGASLHTKVEQLGVAEEKSGVGAQDPVIRQTSLEDTSLLTLGKPLVLGSLDIPGTTRHQDVEVEVELVK